jgi:hypothetical protein
MTLEELKQEGVLDALAEVFGSGPDADDLLLAIGYPLARKPRADSPFSLWWQICFRIEKGRTRGGLPALLEEAAKLFPHNPYFARGGAAAEGPETPDTPGAAIRAAARRLVREWVKQARGPGVFLPLWLEGTGLELGEYVGSWLANPAGAAVALLSGPIGAGKTLGTCQVHTRLQTPRRSPLDLWIPFRDTDLFDHDPDQAIRKLLLLDHPINLWHSDLRCLILDGLDEGMSKHGTDRVLRWLNILLDRAAEAGSKPRVLISGRDVVLDRACVHRELRGGLEAFCTVRGTGPPLELTLRPWDGATLHGILHQYLVERLGERQAAERMQLVQPDALTSPLLYGLAYELLTEKEGLAGEAAAPPLASSWDLTSRWIDFMIGQNLLRHRGPSDGARRRRAAQAVALLLAVSGRGVGGATLNELEEQPLLDRIWFAGDAPAGGPLEESARFAERSWELRKGCLLRCHDGRYAPFHERILIHLAAEALVDGLGAREESGAPPPPPADLDSLLEDDAKFGPAPEALQPGSVFEEVLSYWARHRRRGAALPDPQLTAAILPEQEGPRWRRAAEVMRRDALVRADEEARKLFLGIEKARTLLETSRADRFSLPAGRHVIWRLDGKQERRLAVVEIPSAVRLDARLCTVREFALFLQGAVEQEGRRSDLPQQPEARWRRVADRVDFDREAADLPVSGTTLEEARAYCRWRTRSGDGEWLYRLPEADWLRFAAWGPLLRDLAVGEETGPFGHRELLGRLWQWTETSGPSAQESLVFGGSRSLGSTPQDALKGLVRGWPDLCRAVALDARDPQIGFRVCRVPAADRPA